LLGTLDCHELLEIVSTGLPAVVNQGFTPFWLLTLETITKGSFISSRLLKKYFPLAERRVIPSGAGDLLFVK
jgi:hypothetical protein